MAQVRPRPLPTTATDPLASRHLTCAWFGIGQATRRAQEAEAKAAACEARTRELEAELQTAAAAAGARAAPAHAEVVRESMVSSINMPVTDFGDISLLSDVSEDDEAMRAFNAGVGRRYTAGALARATSIGPVVQPPLYEAILDYSSTTNAGNDLHFRKGDRIRVTEKGQEGWWYVLSGHRERTRAGRGQDKDRMRAWLGQDEGLVRAR